MGTGSPLMAVNGCDFRIGWMIKGKNWYALNFATFVLMCFLFTRNSILFCESFGGGGGEGCSWPDGQTQGAHGKWREKDKAGVNNEIGERFASLLHTVLKEVTKALGWGLIDF